MDSILQDEAAEYDIDIADIAHAYKKVFSMPPEGIDGDPFIPPMFIAKTCTSPKTEQKFTIYTREVSNSARRVALAYGFPLFDVDEIIKEHTEFHFDPMHLPLPTNHELFNVLLNIIKQNIK